MPSGVYDHYKIRGRSLSEETKAKMRKAHEGKTLSEEAKAKLRKAHLGKKRGSMSEEQKAKLRAPRPHVDQSAEKNNNFKGVDHPRDYHWTCNEKLTAEVRDRDNQTCQLCGEIWSGEGNRFETHHIYNDPELLCNVKKLITLCKKCHGEVTKNFADYIPQFELIVNQEFVWCGT